jgi:5-methyltetrahydropteroyltriglutamate--homocysteine methyltransferase
MTGPHLLAAVAYDEYYNDLPRMMNDLGKLLHQNFRRVVAAGCMYIQIDEPYFTVADEGSERDCPSRLT